MNWFAIAKFAAPLLFIAGVYFYAHDAGWKERDAECAAEKQTVADETAKAERSACRADINSSEEIHDDYQKKLAAISARHADALGRLYDATHANRVPPDASAAEARADGTSNNRLYYANATAARAAIERAQIASAQAAQLGSCIAYVKKVNDIQ